MALTKIKFPVLKSINVSGFMLFPGSQNTGLKHNFSPGITVIAGVNGLGKTTLLNMFLMGLIGPWIPRKFDAYNPAGGVHEMIYRESNFFAKRVPDYASEATLETKFTFGETVLNITRSLEDLSILKLTKDGAEIDDPTENHIWECSGVGSHYDFFFIVRYFTFFLEDKVSLIWNPQGQFEVFRILFLDRESANQFADLTDKIKKVDSAARNTRAGFGRIKNELERAQKTTEGNDTITQELALLRIGSQGLEKQRIDLNDALHNQLKTKSTLLENLGQRQLELEEVTRAYEKQLQEYFIKGFPKISDTVRVMLSHIASGDGECLVCENPHPSFPTTFRTLAAKGQCPFCQNETIRHSPVIPVRAIFAEEIHALELKLDEVKRTVDVLSGKLLAIDNDINTLSDRRRAVIEELSQTETRVARLATQLPIGQEQISKELEKVASQERLFHEQVAERIALEKEYAKYLVDAKKTVEAVTERLTQKFHHYAGKFLAESCNLNRDDDKRRLGQEGELFEFPSFHVAMTSALTQSVGTRRSGDGDVSESQKEFIDLAFRMALFDAITETGDKMMLVIETPEASLDAIFVKSAGDLLRGFAEDQGREHIIITSCNLSQAKIIHSLLGIANRRPEEIPDVTDKFLINLLDEAAPNAALRTYGKQYRAQLESELTP